MKKIKNLLNQKGLTLVELLAVLVIIAIIAAIAVPIVNNVISDSDDRAEAAEALNIISSAKLAELSSNIDCSTENACTKASLTDYIQSSVGEFTLSRSGDAWTITNHPINSIEGVNGTGVSASLTEAQIETYLETTN